MPYWKDFPGTYYGYSITSSISDGGYFSLSILNSFPEAPCLLYCQLSHKTKKIVLCGTNNSGKSSWNKNIFGLINRSQIVCVTQQKTFGLRMVDENIELTFIHEWSENILFISNIKILFHGN